MEVNNLGVRIKYEYSMEKLVGFEYNNTRYFYERNIQGDVIRIYRRNDLSLVAEYAYDAYGTPYITMQTNEHIGDINPIRYRGYYYDTESHLYYCSSRYYNPKWGRFISPDSIEYLDPNSINGLNLYAYCGNNPVNRFDPSGHFPITAMLITGLIM